MGNEVAAQRGTGGLSFAVPAHLQTQMAAAGGGNIREGFSVNQLTFAGKEWAMTVNGERKVLQRVNEDGDVEKLQTLRVIVLDQGGRGRNYYENWDPNNPRGPDCWSEDGKKPHPSVEAPRHLHCDGCPMSIKGSKVADGYEGVACRSFKYLAVLPVKGNAIAYDFPPLRLKLSPTSIWDENRPDDVAQGWYAWDNFTKYLRSNGVGYTNAMVVRMRFASTNHPQIQFARGDFLEADDFQKTLKLAQTEDVQKLLGYIPMASSAPKGKPLPKDEPAADPVFSKTSHAAEAAQKAENEKQKAEAQDKAARELLAKQRVREEAAAAAEAQQKADAKAAKIAAAKAAAAEAARLAAEAEAEDAAPPTAPTSPADEGWDEPVAAPKAAAAPAKADTPPPVKKTEKRDPPAAPASAPAEVPAALTGILSEWD